MKNTGILILGGRTIAFTYGCRLPALKAFRLTALMRSGAPNKNISVPTLDFTIAANIRLGSNVACRVSAAVSRLIFSR